MNNLVFTGLGRRARGRTQSFVVPFFAAVSKAEGVNVISVRSSPSIYFTCYDNCG